MLVTLYNSSNFTLYSVYNIFRVLYPEIGNLLFFYTRKSLKEKDFTWLRKTFEKFCIEYVTGTIIGNLLYIYIYWVLIRYNRFRSLGITIKHTNTAETIILPFDSFEYKKYLTF